MCPGFVIDCGSVDRMTLCREIYIVYFPLPVLSQTEVFLVCGIVQSLTSDFTINRRHVLVTVWLTDTVV